MWVRMKLSKLYSNMPEEFAPIDFQPGLNVILAEIRLPENRDKDTHNLGKTTLGILIDFCLLSSRDKSMFLFKHIDIFAKFIFFLEIQLSDGSYVTIRRSVEDPSKICFKRDVKGHQNFAGLPLGDWDHQSVPFARARSLLDGLLNLTSVQPWDYRKGLGYLLRRQDDYSDIFQLRRYAGRHSDWKPYVVHILGFDSALVSAHYQEEDHVDKLKDREKVVESELGGTVEDLGKVEGTLLLKQEQVQRVESRLDAFDFRQADKDAVRNIVNELDEQIAGLNSQRYSLSRNRKKITDSLRDSEIMFDPEEAAGLFEEAGVLFAGQIRRDYEQLIEFNREITDERRKYLLEEKEEIDAELRGVNAELNRLGKQRAKSLSFLTDSDVLNKYRQVSSELVELRSDVTTLSRQREHLKTLQRLRSEIRDANDVQARLEGRLESEFDFKNSSEFDGLYKEVRLLFDRIVDSVIGQSALLTVSLNKEHNPVFDAEILNSSRSATSADRGHSYKKLLCIAFDLAVLGAYRGNGFPSFAYHDGVFESLDKRKKANLLEVMREFSDDGVQQIITLIDTDMPPEVAGAPPFSDDEIVLKLHDEGPDGLLFKMPEW